MRRHHNRKTVTSFPIRSSAKINRNSINTVGKFLQVFLMLVFVVTFLKIIQSRCYRKRHEKNSCLLYLNNFPLMFPGVDSIAHISFCYHLGCKNQQQGRLTRFPPYLTLFAIGRWVCRRMDDTMAYVELSANICYFSSFYSFLQSCQ